MAMLVMLLQRTFYASPTSTKPPPWCVGASAWAHDVLVTDIRRRFKRSLNQFRGLAFDLSGNGGGVEFVTILGPNLPASLTVNELTTVAASYSMAQFYRTGVIAG